MKLYLILVLSLCVSTCVWCHGSHSRHERQMMGPPGGGGGGMTVMTATNYNYGASTTSASSDPLVTSWVKSTGKSATYSGYTNVNKIQYSSTYVYLYHVQAFLHTQLVHGLIIQTHHLIRILLSNFQEFQYQKMVTRQLFQLETLVHGVMVLVCLMLMMVNQFLVGKEMHIILKRYLLILVVVIHNKVVNIIIM